MRIETQIGAFLLALPRQFLTADGVEKYITAAIELYNLLAEPVQIQS
jgi:hypothetical protein